MMSATYKTSIAAALFALCCAACGPTFQATTPAGFVELEDEYDDFDYRATSADGVVVAVREIEHDPQGEAAFWIKAIKNRMRERAGYALLETKDVTSADGVKGTQLRFGHDQDGGKPHLYYVTLFVTPDTLFLLEAGGSKKLMTDNAADVDRAVAAFSTR
jgi:hypothetical protein